MATQAAKVAQFRALHAQKQAFVMANAWNIGSAKQLARLGFEALGTTSAGIAMELGVADGEVGRDRSLAVAQAIVAATDLPVSADLENLFGDDPETCAETIRMAIATGLAGASIEDYSGPAEDKIYPFELAVERVRAAVAAVRASGGDFVLTARAENFLRGRPDLEDTIRRLKAYEAAGADVLFAPGLPSYKAIQEVCQAVDKPVNVLMGIGAPSLTVDDLTKAGVARISLGSALARTAEAAFVNAASWIKDRGSFAYRQAAEAAFR
ncbi:isocitrate lyase/PEP mutase family protein [Rhodoligotrophos defluvii]|uniref:isocitrate lyase/PEP mutase family protein n=1 Tax=Rhodoligotrophos defluvii TaxID=2561934 RepID=UPI0010C99636|nr:isocitrate lyase/phosphoenolpyruvate mutase family protein [Rhodoligotrophos defluvii]